MRWFYFSDENDNNVAPDYHGNIRGAQKVAQSVADKDNKVVYIEYADCINEREVVDIAYPQKGE